jgi:hypothetical protein
MLCAASATSNDDVLEHGVARCTNDPLEEEQSSQNRNLKNVEESSTSLLQSVYSKGVFVFLFVLASKVTLYSISRTPSPVAYSHPPPS